MKTKAPLWKRMLCALRNLITAILVFALLLAGLLALTARKVTSEKTVERVVGQVDLYELCDSALKDETGEADGGIAEKLSEMIENGEEHGLSGDAVRTLVESEEVKSFVSDTLNNYLQSFEKGEEETPITKDNVLGLLHDLEKKLPEAAGFDAKWDYKEIEAQLDEVDFEEYKVERLLKDTPVSFGTAAKTVRYLVPAATVLLVLAAGFAALQFLWNRKTIGKGFLLNGFSVLFAAAIPVILFWLLRSAPAFLEDLIPDTVSDMIGVLDLPGTAAYLVLGLGAALILTGTVLNIVASAKRKKYIIVDIDNL